VGRRVKSGRQALGALLPENALTEQFLHRRAGAVGAKSSEVAFGGDKNDRAVGRIWGKKWGGARGPKRSGGDGGRDRRCFLPFFSENLLA